MDYVTKLLMLLNGANMNGSLVAAFQLMVYFPGPKTSLFFLQILKLCLILLYSQIVCGDFLLSVSGFPRLPLYDSRRFTFV